ncbi:MAG: hypothetical protein GXY82_11130 [Methanospirillum sp.]|nr:hypothetical protein [Methanospirillum sp.]
MDEDRAIRSVIGLGVAGLIVIFTVGFLLPALPSPAALLSSGAASGASSDGGITPISVPEPATTPTTLPTTASTTLTTPRPTPIIETIAQTGTSPTTIGGTLPASDESQPLQSPEPVRSPTADRPGQVATATEPADSWTAETPPIRVKETPATLPVSYPTTTMSAPVEASGSPNTTIPVSTTGSRDLPSTRLATETPVPVETATGTPPVQDPGSNGTTATSRATTLPVPLPATVEPTETPTDEPTTGEPTEIPTEEPTAGETKDTPTEAPTELKTPRTTAGSPATTTSLSPSPDGDGVPHD